MEKKEKQTFYSRFVHFICRYLELFIAKLLAVQRRVEYEKYMLEFGQRKDDVYVVTFPKSGTTLTQMILYQLFTDGNMDFKHLYDVSPWIRNDVFEGRPCRELKDRRIIKSHDHYSLMPIDFKGKIIFVFRNGMDVAVSMYHQKKNYTDPDLTFESFLKYFYKEGNMNWFLFNKRWLENKRNYDILYLSYEELTKQKEKSIDKIIGFCGINRSSVDIDRVMERSSFEFMKLHEDKFGDRPREDHRIYDEFIRKGESGKGQDYFEDHQKDFYTKAYKRSVEPLLKKAGLK